MKYPKFKIRCSQIGKIMGGNIGLSDAQHKQFLELVEKKQEKKKAGKDITDKQKEKLAELVEKSKCKELPKGAKTYVKQWVKEVVYNRRLEIKSKYLTKGISCEDAAISLLESAQSFDELLMNNKEQFSDDWMTGEPDIITGGEIIDIKNAYTFSSFDLFEDDLKNEDYALQVLGYMSLTGKRKGRVVYTLLTAPDHIIESEAKSLMYKEGFDKEAAYNRAFELLNYDDIDPRLRLLEWEVEWDGELVEKIRERVEACREYANALFEKAIKKGWKYERD